MAKKEIEDIRITPAENGGMTVHCCYKRQVKKSSKEAMGIGYDSPTSDDYVFGASEGAKAAAFILKAIGIKGAAEEAGEKEHDGDEDED
jgi:hypothetical protein